MKVFISHSHTDTQLAARVSDALEKSGLEVWDPDREILPGDNWASKVSRALEESKAMVVLLTPAAINSPYVMREIEYALGAKNFSNRLIPVVVGDPKLLPKKGIPWIVRRLPWIVRRLPWFGLKDAEADEEQVEPIAEAILSRA